MIKSLSFLKINFKFNPIDDGVIIYVTMSYDNIYAAETVIYELYDNPDEFIFKETELADF